VSGGETIAGVGKALELSKKALSQDPKVNEKLIDLATETSAFKTAARIRARRIALKERILLRIFEPLARLLGLSEEYYAEQFIEELAEKLERVPDENLIIPPGNVLIPVITNLGFSFDQVPLKELYLKLLAASSDNRRATDTHPAFAEIIKQLHADEVGHLNGILSNGQAMIARLKEMHEGPEPAMTGYRTVYLHLAHVLDDDSHEAVEDPRIPTWLENWCRLGLVSNTYSEYSQPASQYDWVMKRPEYVRIAEASEYPIKFDMGLARVTPLGSAFLNAVS
jgi:hypothetical protein